MLYSLDEICLIPSKLSEVEHRGDGVVFDNHDRYPIFTAPMSCIVNQYNVKHYKEHRINAIVPRTVDWTQRYIMLKEGEWVAVGQKEAEYLLENLEIDNNKVRICIDVAQGHRESLLKVCAQLKDKFGDRLKLMAGNIANPNTYKEYARAGVDFIRVGIGGGSVCTTSVQCGMHYPMGSLIMKCKEEKDLVIKAIELGAKYRSVPRVVADGGFKNVDQIVKAYALGADYVMLGGMLAEADEEDGPNIGYKRTYYGMSTEDAQVEMNEASLFPVENFEPQYSEGTRKEVLVNIRLKELLDKIDRSLKISMSYANARTLNEFKGNVRWDTMSPVSYNAYMK